MSEPKTDNDFDIYEAIDNLIDSAHSERHADTCDEAADARRATRNYKNALLVEIGKAIKQATGQTEKRPVRDADGNVDGWRCMNNQRSGEDHQTTDWRVALANQIKIVNLSTSPEELKVAILNAARSLAEMAGGAP